MNDVDLMRLALAEARKAEAQSEVPVGAVVVSPSGEVIGRGRNLRELKNDPTAHAEIVALREAAAAFGAWRLEGCTLVVTLEPCPMCAGAIYLSRISQVVCGVRDARMGAGGSALNILQNSNLHTNIPIEFGILESKSLRILQAFFHKLRKSN